jgi:hypothetical protein
MAPPVALSGRIINRTLLRFAAATGDDSVKLKKYFWLKVVSCHFNNEDLERRPMPRFGAANKTLRRLRRFRVDVAKLTDEVTHITKFFGDGYLARIYLGARDRFYLDQWRTSVEQRLAQLDKLYSVVHAEVNEQRMLWLEIIIVIFFAFDLVILLWVKR